MRRQRQSVYSSCANIAIIGVGLAGLSAAHHQAKYSGRCKPILLEASASIGGRVKQKEDLELGAEFLHGGSAAAKALADEMGLFTTRVFTTAHGDGGPDDEPAPDGG